MRKLLSLTALILSFASRPSRRHPTKFTPDWKIRFTGGSTWRKKAF